MKRRLKSEGIIKDDKGVALTEFVIVIPIVLLLFFAVMQYFDIVRAAQLGNYAAYVASRSYAVQAAAVGDAAAQGMARESAAMALAPIARAVPGELGTPLQFDLSSIGLSFLQSFFGSKYAGTYADGYVAAQAIRLSGVNNFKVTTSGSGVSKQVNVAINYPQPIYLPGLKAMWNFVDRKDDGAGQDIVSQLAPLAAGTDVWAQKLDLFGKINTFPYVNIRSKCSMGYEDWSGTLQTPYHTDSSLGDSLNPPSISLGNLSNLGQAATELTQSFLKPPLKIGSQ